MLRSTWIQTLRYKIKEAERKLLVKWPLVTKHRYLAEVDRAHHYQACQQRAQRELEERNQIIDDVLPKLIRLSLDYPRYGAYRLAVEFSEDFVYQIFCHGDSQQAIRYLADRVGHQVERELTTINFGRVKAEAEAKGRLRKA